MRCKSLISDNDTSHVEASTDARGLIKSQICLSMCLRNRIMLFTSIRLSYFRCQNSALKSEALKLSNFTIFTITIAHDENIDEDSSLKSALLVSNIQRFSAQDNIHKLFFGYEEDMNQINIQFVSYMSR